MTNIDMTNFDIDRLAKYFIDDEWKELPETSMSGMSMIDLRFARMILKWGNPADRLKEKYTQLETLLSLYKLDSSETIYFANIYSIYVDRIDEINFVVQHNPKTVKPLIDDCIAIQDFSQKYNKDNVQLQIKSGKLKLTLKSKELTDLFLSEFFTRISEEAAQQYKLLHPYIHQKNLDKFFPKRRPKDMIKWMMKKCNSMLLNYIRDLNIDFESLSAPTFKTDKSPETLVHDFLVSCDLLEFLGVKSYEDLMEEVGNTSSYDSKVEYCKKILF